MQTQVISFDAAAEILDQMRIDATQTVNGTVIHAGVHPEHDECSLVLGDVAILISSNDGVRFIN
jgi:hypothetical protein